MQVGTRLHYRESEKKGEEDDSEIYRIKAERQQPLYVHEVGSKEPIPGTLGTKKQALHRAAKMNGLDYKDYMRVRRRDGVSCDKD